MKFDQARVLTRVQEFAFSRPASGAGEARAADLVAGRFASCGWKVERAPISTRTRTTGILLWVVLATTWTLYAFWRALRVSLPRGAAVALTVGGLVVIAAALAVAAIWRRRRDPPPRLGEGADEADGLGRINVLASWPGETPAAARVLIVTHLDTTVVQNPREIAVIAVAVGLLFGLWRFHRENPGGAWLRFALGGLLVLLLVRLWSRSAQPAPGDNRTGLALLSELADILPERLRGRVEVRVAAVGSSGLGQLGALTLADAIRRQWPRKPTLIVNLDAPGLGDHLLLVGRGAALAFAGHAARDLWLPHQLARGRWRALDHRPFDWCGFVAVTVGGDRRGRVIDPACLAAAAQLATELALRWGRQGAEVAQGEGATRARSPQNPG